MRYLSASLYVYYIINVVFCQSIKSILYAHSRFQRVRYKMSYCKYIVKIKLILYQQNKRTTCDKKYIKRCQRYYGDFEIRIKKIIDEKSYFTIKQALIIRKN